MIRVFCQENQCQQFRVKYSKHLNSKTLISRRNQNSYEGSDWEVYCKNLCRMPNDIGQNVTYLKMGDFSCVMRKPVFGVSDPVQHKSGCAATEDG